MIQPRDAPIAAAVLSRLATADWARQLARALVPQSSDVRSKVEDDSKTDGAGAAESKGGVESDVAVSAATPTGGAAAILAFIHALLESTCAPALRQLACDDMISPCPVVDLHVTAAAALDRLQRELFFIIAASGSAARVLTGLAGYVSALFAWCSRLLVDAQAALNRAMPPPGPYGAPPAVLPSPCVDARGALIEVILRASPVGALLPLLGTALAALGVGAPHVLVEALGTSPHALSRLTADTEVTARGIETVITRAASKTGLAQQPATAGAAPRSVLPAGHVEGGDAQGPAARALAEQCDRIVRNLDRFARTDAVRAALVALVDDTHSEAGPDIGDLVALRECTHGAGRALRDVDELARCVLAAHAEFLADAGRRVGTGRGARPWAADVHLT